MATYHRFLVAAFAAAAVSALALPAAADTTTNELRVVVLSPEGDPVAGVAVHTPEGTTDGFAATTDARGHVVWSGAPSTVQLCAFLRPTQDLGGPSGWAETCKDFAVDGLTRGALRFTPGAAIGGYVTDARTGGPVAGTTVTFLLASSQQPAGGVTDAHGHYVIRNLDPGRLLYPSARGGSTTRTAPYGYASATVTPWPTVTAGRVLNVPFRISPNVRYTGTVVDGAGTAIAGASVMAGDEFGQTTVTTDVAGSYQVDRPWSLGNADVDPRECAWAAATGDHPTGRAVVCTDNLASGLAVSHRFVLRAEGASLTGKVVRPNGNRPGPGLHVGVPIIGGPAGYVLPGVTAADGSYRIDGLAAGLQQVRATQPPGAAVALSSYVSARAGSVRTVPDIVISPFLP